MNIINNKKNLMLVMGLLAFVAPLCGAGRAHNGARGVGSSRLAGQSRGAKSGAQRRVTRSDENNRVDETWASPKNGAYASCSDENNSMQRSELGSENSHAAGVVESGRTKSTISEFDMAADVVAGCAKLIAAGVIGWQTASVFSDNRSQLNNFLVMVWATWLAGRSAYDELAYLKRKYVDDRESRTASLYNDLAQLKRDFFGNPSRPELRHGVTTEKRAISLGRIIMSGVTAIHMASEAHRTFNSSAAVPDRLVALCYAWCGLLASSDVYDNFKYVFEGF